MTKLNFKLREHERENIYIISIIAKSFYVECPGMSSQFFICLMN
jgi:hypothetical protein